MLYSSNYFGKSILLNNLNFSDLSCGF